MHYMSRVSHVFSHYNNQIRRIRRYYVTKKIVVRCVTTLPAPFSLAPRMRSTDIHAAIEGPTIWRKGSEKYFYQRCLHVFPVFCYNFGLSYRF